MYELIQYDLILAGRMAGTCVKWTAIVLTTANKDWTYAFQKGTVSRRSHLWQIKF